MAAFLSLPMPATATTTGDDFDIVHRATLGDKKTDGWMRTGRQLVRVVLRDRTTRRLAWFLSANVAYAAVEVGVGWAANSLSLLGDGVHMLFDCSAILMNLLAAAIVTLPPSSRFPHGFGRVDILAGFANSAALLFAALALLTEAVERLSSPPEVKTDRLLSVAFVGLCVNLLGLFAFDSHAHCPHAHAHKHSHEHRHSHTHGHGHCHNHAHEHCHGHAHSDTHSHYHGQNFIMRGMFLHILADTLGSVGVILSSLLISHFNFTLADPLCSFFIALLLISSTWPLLKQTTFALLNAVPDHLVHSIDVVREKVESIQDVDKVTHMHVWNASSGQHNLIVHVNVKENSEKMVWSIRDIVHEEIPSVKRVTIQVDKIN